MNQKIIQTDTGYQLGKLHAQGLAPRECQTLLLRATGLSIADCAQTLKCGKSTVQDRVTNMFYKLHVDSTPELITKCFSSGILRFLSFLIALHIGIAAPGDHQFTRARVRVAARPVRTQQQAA
jgi:DNA-binding CsgD family transcriptional regulator